MTAVAKTVNPAVLWNREASSVNNLRQMHDISVFGPAVLFSSITPANNAAFASGPTRGIFAGSSGVLYGQDAFGNQVNGIPVVAGFNPITMAGIDATNTTATNLWGVW
jgi:hypothetical protein